MLTKDHTPFSVTRSHGMAVLYVVAVPDCMLDMPSGAARLELEAVVKSYFLERREYRCFLGAVSPPKRYVCF